jgi:hypothetical protein
MQRVLLIAVSAVLACFATEVTAAQITEMERKQCRDDYHQFCGDYGLDSPALRTCMNKHGHSLSHGCIEALIDAGEVSRAEVERRKRSGH